MFGSSYRRVELLLTWDTIPKLPLASAPLPSRSLLRKSPLEARSARGRLRPLPRIPAWDRRAARAADTPDPPIRQNFSRAQTGLSYFCRPRTQRPTTGLILGHRRLRLNRANFLAQSLERKQRFRQRQNRQRAPDS